MLNREGIWWFCFSEGDYSGSLDSLFRRDEMKHFEPYPLGYFQIDWKRFGELVKLAREENKFSLRGMADFTGISAATLCRCERGESVEADHFFTLLQVLGLPFEIPEEVTKPA